MAASQGRTNLRPLTILLVAVAVVTSAGVGVLGALVPRFVVPPPPPLAIRSVAVSPNPPIPGQQVSIVAVVSGRASTLSVSLGYASAFAGQNSGGGVPMLPNGQGGFEGTIGPFGPGTEVWFVVAASTSDQGPLLSNYTSFQVGDVYRNESAGLRVTNVSRSIQDPQPFDTVTVRADILGGLNLSQANVLTLEATRGIAFGFFNPMRRGGNNSYYEGEVFPPSLGGETIVAYFVAVQDVSQNTAVSSLFTYRVASSAVP